MPADAAADSPALLRRAVDYYARSRQVAHAAIEELNAHLDLYPQQANVFAANVDRLEMLLAMLAGDAAYGRLVLDDGDRGELRSAAAEAYRRADDLALDYLMRYHADDAALPAGVDRRDAADLPDDVQEQVYAAMLALRIENPLTYEAGRVLDEFAGYRQRAAARLANLGA